MAYFPVAELLSDLFLGIEFSISSGPGLSKDVDLKVPEVGVGQGVSLFIENLFSFDRDLVGTVGGMIPMTSGPGDRVGAVGGGSWDLAGD